MPLVYGLHFKNLRGDIYGGLVAAVVALPLALAFGVASGAGAIAGLYGAIFVGFFAALFGGTPAQVSGPTGPMTVVMAALIAQSGHEPALAFTAVILGGGLQILLGISGLGRFILLVPYPVISGFMSGIGCIIIVLQLGPLVGHPTGEGGIFAAIQALPGSFADPVFDAALVGLITLAIVYLTPEFIGKLVPPPLIALLAGTLLTELLLPNAPVIGEIPQGFPTPILPTLHMDSITFALEEAVVLALLGSTDSLLTSLVCDNMTRSQHNSNRELIGQGIGNMVSGVFGGLPGAGATMRSVANIRTGGRTPVSGVFHALILLTILLGAGPLAERIPLAVLSGILLKVGVDIIDWRFLRHTLQAPRPDVLIMGVVLLTTVLVDLIVAFGLGFVLASLFFVKRMADHEITNLRVITEPTTEAPLIDAEAEILTRNKGRIILIHIDGPMGFGSAKTMVRRLESIRQFGNFKCVVLDLSSVPMIDGTSALAVEDMIRMVQAHDQHLYMVGMQPAVMDVLRGLGVLTLIQPGHHYPRRLEALQHAAAQISGTTYSEAVPTGPQGASYLFRQESQVEDYDAQAFVLRCFDNRFWHTTKGFLNFMGVLRFDPVTVAGGAKVLASPEHEQDFEYMMRELDKSIRLHNTKRCLLFTHHDCGAYGGFSRFMDAEEELTFHQTEHKKIRANIVARFPHLRVETFFVDTNGVIKTSENHADRT